MTTDSQDRNTNMKSGDQITMSKPKIVTLHTKNDIGISTELPKQLKAGDSITLTPETNAHGTFKMHPNSSIKACDGDVPLEKFKLMDMVLYLLGEDQPY